MTPMEIIKKIRKSKCWMNPEWEKMRDETFQLTEAEAAALITSKSSKTAEELHSAIKSNFIEIKYLPEGFYAPLIKRMIEADNKHLALIQSTLDAYAKVKVKEAARRLCNECDNFVNTTTGEHPTTCTRDPKSCELLAATLGMEIE